MIVETVTKASRHARIGIAVAVVVLISAAMYNWLVVPHTAYLHAARNYQNTMNQMATKTGVIRKSLALKRQELEELKQALAEKTGMIFSPSQAKQFFAGIETIAGQCSCQIVSINFLVKEAPLNSQEAQLPPEVTSQSVIVKFVANYSDIMLFVKNITTRPQKVSVDYLKIESDTESSILLNCEAIFTVYTAVQKGEQLQ
ncbi:MAG: hypothetical protein ABIG61_02390 [Planctomycetota bacterium]